MHISFRKGGIRLSTDGWLCYRTLCGPSYRRDFKVALSPKLLVVAYAIVSQEHMYDEIRVSFWYTIDYREGAENPLNYKTASNEWRFRRTLRGCRDARIIVKAVRDAVEQQAGSDIDESLKHHITGLPMYLMSVGKGSMKVNTAEILARMKIPSQEASEVVDRVGIPARA